MTVILDFVPYAVPLGHPNWQKLIELVANDDTVDSDLLPLLDIPKSVADFMTGAVEYNNRSLTYNGEPLNNFLTQRIIQHMEAGDPKLAAPLIRFLENVMNNPSYRAVNGLYEWVARSGLPITEDGQILAWKAVANDYKDIHSGTTNCSIGNVVTMPRNQCDEDPDRTCSTGLHFCSASYLRNYASGGSRVVVVKINPADVTAIPKEYDCEKGRCCRYEVIGEVPHDKVADYYDVSTVWVEPSKFEVGQKWRTRNGDFATITIVLPDDRDFETIWAQVEDVPRSYFSDGNYFYDEESCFDLIELIVENPAFAAGQVWEQRDGNIVTIVSIDDCYINFDEGEGCVYPNGRAYEDETLEDDADLIRCVK